MADREQHTTSTPLADSFSVHAQETSQTMHMSTNDNDRNFACGVQGGYDFRKTPSLVSDDDSLEDSDSEVVETQPDRCGGLDPAVAHYHLPDTAQVEGDLLAMQTGSHGADHELMDYDEDMDIEDEEPGQRGCLFGTMPDEDDFYFGPGADVLTDMAIVIPPKNDHATAYDSPQDSTSASTATERPQTAHFGAIEEWLQNQS